MIKIPTILDLSYNKIQIKIISLHDIGMKKLIVDAENG